MICKSCKREIDDDSIFCKYCGERQIKKPKERREVSVPKPVQLPSGSWSAGMMINKQRITVTEPTEAKYYARARAIKSGLLKLETKPPRCNLGSCIDDYLSERSNILSPSTLRSYRVYRRTRFTACMTWDVRAPQDWQRAINDEAEAVSAKTVHNAWALCTAAMRAKGITPPAVDLPRKVRTARPWLDYKELPKFLDAIRDQPCELAALLGLHSLRLSEILAVTPADIHLDAQCFDVHGSLIRTEDGVVYKPTNKTDTSFRTVPIIIPRLAELLADVPPDAEYVVSLTGAALYGQINALCTSVGLPCVGVHGLRHSFASLAYHLDWTKKSTMQIGGWANSRVVDEIYSHNADLDRDVKRMRRHYAKAGK